MASCYESKVAALLDASEPGARTPLLLVAKSDDLCIANS
jgi:hypothetical protein